MFQPKELPTEAEGRLLVSRDGNARLLIGAFGNDERLSLRAYRQYLLERNYPGASIDYAPVRKNWFVLSGERDGVMFYERVSFTCGGRLITSWAMFYPVAERRFLAGIRLSTPSSSRQNRWLASLSYPASAIS